MFIHSDINQIGVKYMPRGPRERSGNGIYHVMLRGINRQTIFEVDDDRYRFLATVKEYVDAGKYNFYGYCLMDNHVHLLLQEGDDDISTAIKRLSASYVFWYNRKYERCGHLFQERFKSEVVETDNYFRVVLRYIHQNPIKAKMCKDIADYKWTSYSEYIYKPIIIDTDLCLNLFSLDRTKAIDLFIKYMNENNDDNCLEFEEFFRLTDAEVRDKMNKMGVSNTSELQQYNKGKRDEILIRLKNTKGITLRQLSRITGISKSLIGKLK